jgi:hypothetical protein
LERRGTRYLWKGIEGMTEEEDARGGLRGMKGRKGVEKGNRSLE